MLEKIEKGLSHKPPRILVYGYEGVGKSTFAGQAPNPLFLQTEDGLGQIDCAKMPLCENFATVMEQLNAVIGEEHDFQTLVVDSMTAMERLIWDDVCRVYGVKTIEKVEGGFGKGYKIALDWWAGLLKMLSDINQKRNMMIILIAHVGVQTIKDPETNTYDRTAPRLQMNAAEYVSQWCDCVFQAKQKFRVQRNTEGNQTRTIALPLGADGGERVIRTIGNVAVVAKNRYGLPEELPLDFNAVMQYFTK